MMPPKYDGMERSEEEWVRRAVPDAVEFWNSEWTEVWIRSEKQEIQKHLSETFRITDGQSSDKCKKLAWHSAYLSPVVQSVVLRDGEKENEMETREHKAARLVKESGKTTHSNTCATSLAPAEEPSACDCDEPSEAKTKVLAVYPNSTCIEWRGPHGLENTAYYIYPNGTIFQAVSQGWTTEDKAWADAASRLAPAVPQEPTRFEQPPELQPRIIGEAMKDGSVGYENPSVASAENVVPIEDALASLLHEFGEPNDWPQKDVDFMREVLTHLWRRAESKLSAMAGGELPAIPERGPHDEEEPWFELTYRRDQLLSAHAIIAAQGEQIERLKKVEEFVECTGRARAVMNRAQAAELELAGLREQHEDFIRKTAAFLLTMIEFAKDQGASPKDLAFLNELSASLPTLAKGGEERL